MFFLFLFIYLFIFFQESFLIILVFYVICASNFQRLLVVYNIWIVTTFWPPLVCPTCIGQPQVAFLFAVLLFMSIFPFIILYEI